MSASLADCLKAGNRKHLMPPPDDCHHQTMFKSNHKSPWELYTLSGLGRYRAAIQTTVNKLGDLVERFKMLMVESVNKTATNILPITRA